MEVDIGAIEHDMSPLSDLNLMANEVVRTIMSRANKYGRPLTNDHNTASGRIRSRHHINQVLMKCLQLLEGLLIQ